MAEARLESRGGLIYGKRKRDEGAADGTGLRLLDDIDDVSGDDGRRRGTNRGWLRGEEGPGAGDDMGDLTGHVTKAVVCPGPVLLELLIDVAQGLHQGGSLQALLGES